MEELSIKEKAERYDEALDRAKKELDTCGSQDCDAARQVFRLFPELKESEDERVRKEIISYLKRRLKMDSSIPVAIGYWIDWLEKQGDKYSVWVGGGEVNDYYLSKDEAEKLAYKYRKEGYDDVVIEKQCEQKSQGKSALEAINEVKVDNQNCVKPNDKVDPKFKVGDTIKPKDRGHEPWQIMQVDILDKKYRFKDGYVIHFSQEDDYELVEQKPAWSEEDEKIIETMCKEGDLKPSEMQWLKSLKDRVQPKQEWSEEDKRKLRKIFATFELYKGLLPSSDSEYIDHCLSWLKSLRPQNT